MASIADQVLVMCDGKTRDCNNTSAVFYNSNSDHAKSSISYSQGAKTKTNGIGSGLPLVEINQVKTYFKDFSNSSEKLVKAMNDVSLTIHKGEIFGLVGESGSGKLLWTINAQLANSLWICNLFWNGCVNLNQ